MSVVTRLYRGETRFGFIPHRRWFYLASGIVVLICALSIGIRGFNESVEFAGGTQFQVPVSGTSLTVDDVSDAFTSFGHTPDDTPQEVGTGGQRQIVVKLDKIGPDAQQTLKAEVTRKLDLPAGDTISLSSFSKSWGKDVTTKAIEGLIIFLIVVSIYISIRFQWRMAVGGIIALIHDLILAAGIYSLVGFEVSPSTIVGLLTILGFSLYDTVVVYDKVAENSKDILGVTRMTYSEAANLAVNQTLMRSINTSLIALLPVAGLLFVGAGLLGVGTIKDLALILFVGLASGAYSSLFLATPIVVDLTERTPAYRQLTRHVLAKRASDAKKGIEAEQLTPAGVAAARRASGGSVPAPAPRPGARPAGRPARRRR